MKNVANSTLETYSAFSPIATQKFIFSSILSLLEFSIPAVVEEYDRQKNMVIAKPAIANISCNKDNNGNEILVERTNVRVPVLNLGGGGIYINFPLNKGDTGRLIASDRNTEIFNKTLVPSPPNYVDIGKYRYGFFIPDKVVGFSIPNDDEDSTALVIGTLDRSLKISIDNGEVKIIRIKGDVKIDGNLTVSGEVEGNHIKLSTHTHGGIYRGLDNTDAPNP